MAAPVPADVLRAIAHPLRLALLVALEDREQDAPALATSVGVPESVVAQHLAILRDAQLVTDGSTPELHRAIPGWTEIVARLEGLQGQ